MPGIARQHFVFWLSLLAVVFSAEFTARSQVPLPTPSPETAKPSASPSLEREFVKNILRDQKALWAAPFHLNQKDAKVIAPIGLSAMALIATDRITGDEMGELHRQLKASRLVSRAGSLYALGAVSGTFYLVGRKTKDARARETGILGAEGLIDSLVVGGALKAITERARPLAGRERGEFFEGGTSFPSGHAMHAWSFATIVANEYHDQRMVKVAAYGIASAVSVARFTGQKHYLSDVLVGSALGYGIGQYVFHAHHRQNSDTSGQHEESTVSRWPMIAPEYNRAAHSYGVALRWSF